jgi:hypothetical protein
MSKINFGGKIGWKISNCKTILERQAVRMKGWLSWLHIVFSNGFLEQVFLYILDYTLEMLVYNVRTTI